MKVKSNIPQKAEEYFARLEREMIGAVERAMTTTGIRGESLAKRSIKQDAYDTGDLLRSVNHYIQRHPDLMTLIVQATAEHAIIIEKGRKPGRFPNLNALTKWTGRKLREEGINTRVNVSFDQLKALAATSTGKQKDAYRAHLSFLYAVGKSIATRGIKGKMIFKRLERELLTFFRNELQKELNAIL